MKKSFKFTLVELLVVIAIITILATLILPSLKKVRELAKSIKCSSNLKQIYICWSSYTNDFDGRLPLAADAWWTDPSGSSNSSHLWPGSLKPYAGEATKYGVYWDYVKKDGIFWCPSLLKNSTATPYCAYGMHMFGVGGGAGNAGFYPFAASGYRVISQIKYPSMQLLIAEGTYISGGYPDFGRGIIRHPPDIHRRHNGNANVLHCDGHMKAMRQNELQYPDTAQNSLLHIPNLWYHN